MKPTEISFNLLHSLSSNLRGCNFFYNMHLYWKEKKIQTAWLHCLWSKQRLTTAALLIFIPVASNLPVCVTGFQITRHLQMYICEWVLTLAPLECVCTCGWGACVTESRAMKWRGRQCKRAVKKTETLPKILVMLYGGALCTHWYTKSLSLPSFNLTFHNKCFSAVFNSLLC